MYLVVLIGVESTISLSRNKLIESEKGGNTVGVGSKLSILFALYPDPSIRPLDDILVYPHLVVDREVFIHPRHRRHL